MGALPSGHLVEVDRGKLVSQYVGETPKIVRKAVNDAMGGVLFIDEAYSLWSGENDKEGQQAVDTLLKDCEDHRGKFVCLLAGYPVEMQRFMGSNPGMARRFNQTIEFRDYTGPELTQIFRNMAAAVPVTLAEDADQQIGAYFDKVYATRGNRFGNAGTVRNLLDDALGRMRARIDAARTAGTYTPAMDGVLTMADINSDDAKRSVDDILASLDDLVGMEDVKKQIETIAKRVRLNQRRIESGRGRATVDNIHIVITGNPGTGKTTIARLVAKYLKAIGALGGGQLVEVTRADLVGRYTGHTAPLTRQRHRECTGRRFVH